MMTRGKRQAASCARSDPDRRRRSERLLLLPALALAAAPWLVDGCKRSAEAPPAPVLAPSAQAAGTATEPLHGGRTVGWWEDRLSQLRRRSDPEGVALYEATRQRAEANGLEVREQGDSVKLAGRADESDRRKP